MRIPHSPAQITLHNLTLTYFRARTLRYQCTHDAGAKAAWQRTTDGSSEHSQGCQRVPGCMRVARKPMLVRQGAPQKALKSTTRHHSVAEDRWEGSGLGLHVGVGSDWGYSELQG